MKKGNNGITANTKKGIVFGAGTIHKNLTYSGSAWNFSESCIGATKGGSSLEIVPEFYQVQPDGSNVANKGFKRKVGETATMTINLLELTKDIVKSAVVGKDGTSTDSTYDVIESTDEISEGSYLTNIAFVGETLTGKNIIVIMENALCTSGLKLDGANNEESVVELTFECHADFNEGDASSLTTLPYKIYYPKVA